MNKILLSAIIITKNEQDRIDACLEALSFCDEQIIVDNASSDDTRLEARRQGARVISNTLKDFAALRNIGRDNARGNWLLYVDADETVTQALSNEILQLIRSWQPGMPESYALRRKNYYLGKRWPTTELMLRLFRRSSLVGWYGTLHESARVRGITGILHGELIHDTHRNIAEMVQKTNKWSEIEAALRLNVHHPRIASWRLIRVMMTAFWDSYISQQGFKAGIVGLIESIYQSFSSFITYAKLWELQRKNEKNT